MGNFRQNDRTRSGDRDGGRFDMHKAVCGECGANCEVPFRPTGERPVLCSDCFKKQGGGGSRSSRDSGRSSRDSGRSSRFGDNRRERSSSRDRQSFDVVCDKCEKD